MTELSPNRILPGDDPIDLTDDGQVGRLAGRFGVSRETLAQAVRRVGPVVAALG